MTLIAGCLQIHELATDSINARLAKSDPLNCLQRFLEYPPNKSHTDYPYCLTKDPFPANPNFWLKDIDFSCVSPWNDAFGAQRAGTLISKRHLVCASHFPLRKGVRILFTDGVCGVCPCTISETKSVLDTDIQIASLETEVTPNIKPAKILPVDYARYIGDGKGMPIITFTQHEEAFLTQLHAISTNEFKYIGSYLPREENKIKFRRQISAGDSGNPAFLIVGNSAVLLYCLKHGGCGGGPALHRYRREIQQTMDELCPGYKLECLNFTEALKVH